MAKSPKNTLAIGDLAIRFANHFNKLGLSKTGSERGISKTKADKALRAVLRDIGECVMNDGQVQLMGFGTFYARVTGAYKGRNPKTGEKILVPAKKVLAFRGSKSLTVELEATEKLKKPKKKG